MLKTIADLYQEGRCDFQKSIQNGKTLNRDFIKSDSNLLVFSLKSQLRMI